MKNSLIFLSIFFLFISCKCKKTEEAPAAPVTPSMPALDASTTVKGYNILSKLKGIWNGPVTSTTALGSYPMWIVDFRPVSAAQISAKNELDTLNDINMSFFLVYHGGEYKIAFRNGGSFAGYTRISYMACDSVNETTTRKFYRFSDFVKGRTRAFTDVVFSNDSLYLTSYTNKYNTLSSATIHMSWKAKLQDSTSCAAAVTAFNFPQKNLVKDFSTTFTTVTESVYYQLVGDPYTEAQQPYLGKTIASYTFLSSLTVNPSAKVFLMITTQPLFSGMIFNAANLKYRSRYVTLAATDLNFNFNYMHPGTYYYYAFYDANGDYNFTSGEYMSTANTSFTLSPVSTQTTTTQINFIIP